MSERGDGAAEGSGDVPPEEPLEQYPPDDVDALPVSDGETALIGPEGEVSLSDLAPVVMKLVADMEAVGDHLDTVDEALAALAAKEKAAKDAPAEWALFPIPERSTDYPPATLELWVQFYNATYVSTTSSTGDDQNRAIPACWLQHPGLAAEVATLAASWRAGFVGPSADPVAAQNWHDRWRPGFAARMRAWVRCGVNRHVPQPEGCSPEREHRFVPSPPEPVG